MTFEVIRMQWAKRRKADPIREVESVDIPDFKKEQYLLCKMTVKFVDGEVVQLTGQVAQHQITKHWRVNGIDTNGNQVFVIVRD